MPSFSQLAAANNSTITALEKSTHTKAHTKPTKKIKKTTKNTKK